MKLDAKIPKGPIAEKWSNYRSNVKLVAPNNKRRIEVIVIGKSVSPVNQSGGRILHLGIIR